MVIPTHYSQKAPRPSGPPNLLLVNAKVLTLEPGQPRAEAVALRGETIIAVGDQADVARLAGPDTQTIDCKWMCLLPGFVDAHCHLFTTASSLQGLRCGPEEVSNIQRLQSTIQRRAASTPQGGWIRGFGYDELALEERRHPTRWDLDLAAPKHPVRLDHRSGHATVLNSQGLQLARIHRNTPDPVEGVIERKEDSGEPTGLILEMGVFLSQRLGRLRDQKETDEGIVGLSRLLLSYGITSIHDAGANNSLVRWHAIRSLQTSGLLQCRVTMLGGASHLGDFLAEGRRWGDGDHWLRLGHLKTMLSLTTGGLFPDIEELAKIVHAAHQSGFPVAVHAVEQEAVTAAVQVFQGTPAMLSRSMPKDRIEHCAECPPELAAQVWHSGAMVVTQPGFIFWNGDRYRQRVDPRLLNNLYPVGSLNRYGVAVAFGSDSPVIDANPWPAIYTAVTGFSRDGQPLSGNQDGPPLWTQRVPVETALRMYTIAGAYADGTQNIKGTIRPGKLADLVLVDQDPTAVDQETLKDIRPVLTIVGGRVAWEAD
jgi:predicted amidohydrolase YtcJ